MSFDSNQSYTYQIKKYKSGKPIIIVFVIIAIVIFAFRENIFKFLSKPSEKQQVENNVQVSSPENVVRSFIDAMQKNEYDRILTYVDFDAMVLFDSSNQDIDRFNELYNNANEFSDYERQILEETNSYTKKYIKSTLNRIKDDKSKLKLLDLKCLEIKKNNNMNKVVVKILIENDQTNKNEEMIFYTIKDQEIYRIVKFEGEIYFK